MAVVVHRVERTETRGSVPWAVGGFEGTLSELLQLDAERAAEGRTERVRIRRLIELSDAMVGLLERDNLEGVDRIQRDRRPRLAFLCVSVEPRLLARLRRVRTPSDGLDLVFEIQELLLELKRPRVRRGGGL